MIIDLFGNEDKRFINPTTSNESYQTDINVHNPHSPPDPQCLAMHFHTSLTDLNKYHKQADAPITCDIVERNDQGMYRHDGKGRRLKKDGDGNYISNDTVKCSVSTPTIPFYLKPDYHRKRNGQYRTDIKSTVHSSVEDTRDNILVDIVDYILFDRNEGCPIIHLKEAKPSISVTNQEGYRRKVNGAYLSNPKFYLPMTPDREPSQPTKRPFVTRSHRVTDNAKALHPIREMKPCNTRNDSKNYSKGYIRTIDFQDAVGDRRTDNELIMSEINKKAALDKILQIPTGYGFVSGKGAKWDEKPTEKE